MGGFDAEVVEGALRRLAAEAKSSGYRMDPGGWARDRLQVHAWSKQVEVLQSVRDHKRTAVKSCHGSGKDLPLDTLLPTPTGWTSMGRVSVGDHLLGEHGGPVLVVAKSQVFRHDVAEVVFDDGSAVRCGWNHEWATIDARTRQRIRTAAHRAGTEVDWRDHWDAAEVRTTAEIAASLKNHRGDYNHAVPLARPLQGPETGFVQDPYEMGVQAALPSHLMRAALKQREAAFTGVCAAWGSVRADGAVLLALPKLAAAERAAELARTLGHRVVPGGPVPLYRMGEPTGDYAVVLRTVDNPFPAEAEHALERWEKRNGGKNGRSRLTGRVIREVRPVPSVPTQCVQVASDNHLYLAGADMVPTHNSMIASVASAWWLDTHPPGEAIVVSTAPTYAQVNKILWEEIRKHHRRASARAESDERFTPLVGYVTQSDEWKLDNGEIIGFGRKPSDHNIHAFQGIHRRYVLVVIDEACGVAPALWTAVEAITTTGDARILAIGNPDDPDTEFGRVCTSESQADLWNRITISAFDTPNFTDEQVPALLRDVLVQREWVEDRRKAWGEDDPRYQSKVLADFPDNAVSSLFGAQVLANGFDLADERGEGPLFLGVDPARYGDDTTAVCARRGSVAWVQDSWKGMDTTSSARRVLGIACDLRTDDDEEVEVRVDAVGLGAGVVDAAMAMIAAEPTRYRGLTVIEMIGSARAAEEDGTPVAGYGNARALWYDRTRQYMLNGVQKAVMHDQLYEELQGVRFKYSNDRLYIESKDDIRKRTGGSSPDFADAFVYACADRPPLGLQPGDVVQASPEQLLQALQEMMADQMENRISPL